MIAHFHSYTFQPGEHMISALLGGRLWASLVKYRACSGWVLGAHHWQYGNGFMESSLISIVRDLQQCEIALLLLIPQDAESNQNIPFAKPLRYCKEESSAGITIDLIWGSNEAINHMITYRIAKEHDHDSDHLSIETTIATRIEKPQFHPSYNYTKTNWKKLNKKLELYLPTSINDEATRLTTDDIDNHAKELIKIITKAVQETTPRKLPSPYSKR